MGNALPLREKVRAEMNEPLDFCLLNEAIREADSMERLTQLGAIIRREVAEGYEWTRDPENVAWLRREWAAQKLLVEKQGGRLNLQRPRYVTDSFKVGR